jgi:hypothetical protein
MGRPADKTDMSLTAKIFSVLAAMLLVGSLALATLLPPDMSLHEAIHAIDASRADHFQLAVVGGLGKGFWNIAAVPLLMRPVWLIPLCLGLICVGGALSSSFQATPRTKRRQS